MLKFRVFILISILILCLTGGDMFGQQIAVLGDSMSWIGGENCDKPQGWTSHFKKEFKPESMMIFARSGATWTNTRNTQNAPEAYSEVLDDDNVIYNQAIRLIERADAHPSDTPDIIIIYAGTNDAWFENKRPGIFSDISFSFFDKDISSIPPSEVTSLEGSIELVCTLLKSRFPDACMVLVTPLEMTKVSAERIKNVGDIIERAGRKNDITVIRADEKVPVRHAVETKRRTYTYDGVHTNEKGALLISDFLISEISKIIKNTEVN